MKGQEGSEAGAAVMRFGRLVRGGASVGPEPEAASRSSDAEAAEAIVVTVGGVRVAVRVGFDRPTLAAVLEVLASRGGAR